MEATVEYVGARTLEEMERLLHDGYTFEFMVPNEDKEQTVTYEVDAYSEDGDVVLFMSTPYLILYQGIYGDLATLLKTEPISDLGRFIITRK